MTADRVDVYFCGGSHLGNRGVPPTQAFPVLISRALRAAWGQHFGTSRSILLPETATALEARFRQKHLGETPFVFVLLPRNAYIAILPWRVRQWLAAVRASRGSEVAPGIEPVADMIREDAPSPAIKGGGFRNAVAALAFSPTLPARTRAFVREVSDSAQLALRLGAEHVVIGTPIPLSRHKYPGTWTFQAYYARRIRRLASSKVEVVDLFARLSRAQAEDVFLGHDPFHLTRDGHRIVAEELAGVLLRWGRDRFAAPEPSALAT